MLHTRAGRSQQLMEAAAREDARHLGAAGAPAGARSRPPRRPPAPARRAATRRRTARARSPPARRASACPSCRRPPCARGWRAPARLHPTPPAPTVHAQRLADAAGLRRTWPKLQASSHEAAAVSGQRHSSTALQSLLAAWWAPRPYETFTYSHGRAAGALGQGPPAGSLPSLGRRPGAP